MNSLGKIHVLKKILREALRIQEWQQDIFTNMRATIPRVYTTTGASSDMTRAPNTEYKNTTEKTKIVIVNLELTADGVDLDIDARLVADPSSPIPPAPKIDVSVGDTFLGNTGDLCRRTVGVVSVPSNWYYELRVDDYSGSYNIRNWIEFEIP